MSTDDELRSQLLSLEIEKDRLSTELEFARMELDTLKSDRHRLVVVESPYAGNRAMNLTYARAAIRWCLLNDWYPIASHTLYTQVGVLDDDIPEERALGIKAGLAWGQKASRSFVFTDLGISIGMRLGIDEAERVGRIVEYKTLPGWRQDGMP